MLVLLLLGELSSWREMECSSLVIMAFPLEFNKKDTGSFYGNTPQLGCMYFFFMVVFDVNCLYKITCFAVYKAFVLCAFSTLNSIKDMKKSVNIFEKTSNKAVFL